MATLEIPEGIHFKDYWRVIRMRSGIIISLFLLCLVTGYVASAYFIPKQYGGTVQIRILKDEKNVQVFDARDPVYYDPVFFESETRTLESKEILYPVIEKLDLNKTWSARYYNNERQLREDETYDLLRHRHLNIEPQRGSNIIEITALSEDIDEAPRIANAVAKEYVALRTNKEQDTANQGLQTVKDQIAEQSDVVKQAKQKVETLRGKLDIDVTGTVGSQNEIQLTDQELQRKQQMLDEQRSDTEARRVRLESLKSLTDAQLINALPALGLEDPSITQIHEQQLQAASNLEALLKGGYGPDHPRVQSLQASVTKLTQELNDLAEGKRTALKIDLDVSQEKLALLQKNVDALRDRVRTERSEKMAPYLEAVKEAETQQLVLDQLSIRFKQESVDKQVTGDPAQIISVAEPNPRPVKPILLLNLALSGAAGLILGLSIAFFIEHLDTSIKSLAEAERILGVPVLTIVPQHTKPLNQEAPDSPHAETYRILRARIDLQAGTNQGNALTVLSGGPGEGKSTTLFNLAYVCAQAGQSVVIVDADLRRPSLHRILGMELGPGLSDLLETGGSITDYIIPSAIPNLHVVLAGSRPNESKSRFSSQTVRQLLDELKASYQVVLLDSPPALGVSDASVIAHEVDKTILVIQHRRYPRDISLRAKRAIEEVQGNLVGVVLNAVSLKSDEGYYYYSAYADYYNKPQRPSKKKKASKESGTENGNSSSPTDRKKNNPIQSDDF